MIERENLEDGIYAITFTYVANDGIRYIFAGALGTGFNAHYRNAIWTNAHVVEGLREALTELAAAGRDPVPVVMEAKGGRQFRIPGLRSSVGMVHPGYDGTPGSPDIGVFFLDTNLTRPGMSILPREHLDDLSVGQPVGTLGFPGEISITGGNDDYSTATPTFKDGTISALRLLGSGAAQHVQLQYNFDTTGGTSGSPVFDQDGWVIGVNHAGPEALVIDIRTGDEVRIGLGSLDRGIRADAVWDFIDCCTSSTVATAPSRNPSATYQPFPENWNGKTILPQAP